MEALVILNFNLNQTGKILVFRNKSVPPMLNDLSTILSLIIALISLFISLVALKISRKTFIYSSKEYIPDISFKILDDDSIEIINNSNDLYQIDCVNYIKIRTLGFEDYKGNAVIEMPYIEKSIQYGIIDKIGKTKRLTFNFESIGPCAYFCAYDKELIKKIQSKIKHYYSLDSKRGYALPSLQGLMYIIEIVYSNSFLNRNSLIYKQEHVHGLGFDKTKISAKMLNRILTKSNIPKFKNAEKMWSFVNKRFSNPADKYYGK